MHKNIKDFLQPSTVESLLYLSGLVKSVVVYVCVAKKGVQRT